MPLGIWPLDETDRQERRRKQLLQAAMLREQIEEKQQRTRRPRGGSAVEAAEKACVDPLSRPVGSDSVRNLASELPREMQSKQPFGGISSPPTPQLPPRDSSRQGHGHDNWHISVATVDEPGGALSATSSPSTASAAMVSSAAVSSQLLPAMSASTRQRLAMQRLSGPRRPTPAAGKRLARAQAPRDAVEGGRRLSVRPSEQAKDEDELIRELRSQLRAQQVVISEQGQLLEQLSGWQGVDPAACPPLADAAALAYPRHDDAGSSPPAAASPPTSTGHTDCGETGDTFTSAIKACVRSDRTRCGRLDGHAVLRICDRYGLQVPAHTEDEARRKASLSYVRFIDRLREI